ncbi:MAG: GtrA family protein [Cytophagaceae bacterium]|nr:GtrA family protein [Cytophagaceae bacterium]
MIKQKYSDLFQQALRYMAVGLFATLLNYGVFYFLLEFGKVNYLIASGTGFFSGVIAGYFFNRKWTFAHSRSSLGLLIKYNMVYLLSLALSLIILKVAVDYLRISPELGNIFAIGITTCTNFFGLKYLVFKKAIIPAESTSKA